MSLVLFLQITFSLASITLLSPHAGIRNLSSESNNDGKSQSRHRKTIIATMLVGVLSVPAFLLCRQLGLEIAQIVVGTLGYTIAILWAPMNIYIGLRTGARTELVSGLIAAVPCMFWLWWTITH